MKRLFCIAALCLMGTPGHPPTRILFIGNSFTYGALSPVMHYQTGTVHDLNPPDAMGRRLGGVPAIFQEFTREAGLAYDASLETVGGTGLDYHLAEKKRLIDRPWDVVVAQSYSTLDEAHPGNPALLISATRRMAKMFAARNPSVKFYLVATWSRADMVYPPDATGPWKGAPVGQMAMDIEKGYEAAARNTKAAGVIPVGLAWNRGIAEGLADNNPYDDRGARKMNLWAYDNYHASAFGYYLAAAMDFGNVTGKDPMLLAVDGVDHVAEDLGISPQQKQALLKLAHESLASRCMADKKKDPRRTSTAGHKGGN
jgi:hypothetical protein